MNHTIDFIVSSIRETVIDIFTNKVKRLREKYIVPLNDILTSLEHLQTEQKEAQKATKELEKAEKHLSKAQSKPKKKLKPNEKNIYFLS